MSHSFGPRWPKSARKPSRASANLTTAGWAETRVAETSAAETAATPRSNSALSSGEALASRDSCHRPHDGDADGTSP